MKSIKSREMFLTIPESRDFEKCRVNEVLQNKMRVGWTIICVLCKYTYSLYYTAAIGMERIVAACRVAFGRYVWCECRFNSECSRLLGAIVATARVFFSSGDYRGMSGNILWTCFMAQLLFWHIKNSGIAKSIEKI